MSLQWLEWAQQLQAIAQNGLTFADDPFDRERYEAIRSIAAAIMAGHTDLDVNQARGLFADAEGYMTPKVDVRGAVFRDEKILLVRERLDGLWTLPGGWADVGDTPSGAVEREIFEESGYRARAVKLLAAWDRRSHPHPPIPFHAYKLFFLCELVGGQPAESLETSGVGFFERDALPPLSLARVTPAQIARLFEHYAHPDWPTDFD